ncbi:hypothetical protein ASG35_09375 [Burkholderia sp. Leaf177]|uniref:YncE family protein n=1 Tax=Burkholderia sp. Leaf177 TaxID=1736287 RepID=UPI0006FD18E3|nr:hypothetical protein [Burkholderia sp. Leaf177]KQR78608.1 hypothetical protein ASG35_09375 [Burkholderia sp. Leaf177]
MKVIKLIAIINSILFSTLVSAAPLTLQSTTPLPEITGGDFDHFAADLKRHRLYVSAEIYGSIEVFNLPDGSHLASERSVARTPHKIALTDSGDELFIADAGSASARIVDTKTFALKQAIPLEAQPDSGVVDRRTGIFYLGNGGAQSHKETAYISLISMAKQSVISRISVPAAQIKAMATDPATERLFVNFRDKNEVGIVDLRTRKLMGVWPVPGPSRNSAMAFDSQSNRLFIGSRNPGKLFVLDAKTGAVVQALDIVETSDEIIFDRQHKQLFVAGSNGLDVIRQIDNDHYKIVQHVDTMGGKTATYIPSMKKLYVVHTKSADSAEAGLQVFRVN